MLNENGDMMKINIFFEIILLISIFIGVLGLTYVITKKMAQLNKRMTFNKNMKIIEVLQLGQGQYLYIVQIGASYHVIGSSNKGNISYCTELKADDLTFEEIVPASFKEQLGHLMKVRQMNEDDKK